MQFKTTPKNKTINKDAIIKEHVDTVVEESKKAFETLSFKTSITKNIHDSLLKNIEQKSKQHDELLDKVDKLMTTHNEKVAELHAVNSKLDSAQESEMLHQITVAKLENLDKWCEKNYEKIKIQKEEIEKGDIEIEKNKTSIKVLVEEYNTNKRQFETDIYNQIQKFENLKKEIAQAQFALGGIKSQATHQEKKNAEMAEVHAGWEKNLEVIKKAVEESEKYKLNCLQYADVCQQKARDEHDALIAEAQKHESESASEMERLKDLKSATETKYKRFNLLRDKLIEDLIATNIVNDNKDIKNLINQIRLI